LNTKHSLLQHNNKENDEADFIFQKINELNQHCTNLEREASTIKHSKNNHTLQALNDDEGDVV
jgi:cell division protein ZapA (FtsZ GTPase activity inhibitor)